MSRPRPFSSLLCVVLSIVCLSSAGAARQPSSPSRDRHVIVISLDGFPAFALDDPRLPVPTLRKLARQGAQASAMIPVNPVVTWPNHTTFVTGVTPARHEVLYNGLLERDPGGRVPRIEPWRDKRLMVKAPTVYDAAHAAGLTTAQVDWVAIHHAETITWAFPERPDPDGAIEQEMIAAGPVTRADIETFNRNTPAAWRDEVWTDAAVHMLERHRPNLLLFHLLALDSTHHTYGPRTLASTTAMAFLDSQVARLLEAIDRAGIRETTTVVIVSDHGFRVARKSVEPNVLLRQAGLIRGEGAEMVADAWSMSWGGAAGIYVRDAAKRAELVPRIRALLEGVEGVVRVVDGAGLTALGLPDPAASTQAPDLVVAVADGYDVGRADTGPVIADVDATHVGHHGALNSEPSMRAIFFAWGRDVAAGTQLGEVRALDVAPTIAEWLGVALPNVDGESLAAKLKGH